MPRLGADALLRTLAALPLPLQILGASLALALALCLLERYVTGVPYPPSIPLVREPAGTRRFSLRTRLAYYTDCRTLFEDAWNQVTFFPPSLSLSLS